MEHIRRCNTCGKVYCYTDKDVSESNMNALMGGLSAIGGLATVLGGGSIFHLSEHNRRMDRYNDKTIDFEKCPHCNSRNTELISEGELLQTQIAGGAQATKRIEINSNATTENLLKRAEMFLQDEEWANADGYAEAVLDVDPENALAYVYKLMAELKVCDIDELKHQKQPFDGNKNYKKAVRFGDENLVKKLTAALQFINNRNEEEKKKKEEERKQRTYNSYVQKMNSAVSEEDYLEAAKCFEGISAYRDAKKLAKQCREKAEVARKDKIYAEAVELMAKPGVVNVNSAKEKFQSIFDWKDSAEKIEACKERVMLLEKKKEEAQIAAEKNTKQSIAITGALVGAILVVALWYVLVGGPKMNYNKAVELIADGEYDEAIVVLEELGEYQDANNLLDETKGLKKEAMYQEALRLWEAGATDDALGLFNEIMKDGEYKDCAYYEPYLLGHERKLEDCIAAYEKLPLDFLDVERRLEFMRELHEVEGTYKPTKSKTFNFYFNTWKVSNAKVDVTISDFWGASLNAVVTVNLEWTAGTRVEEESNANDFILHDTLYYSSGKLPILNGINVSVWDYDHFGVWYDGMDGYYDPDLVLKKVS